jgi:simple sugar transport system ATP-binding protein
VAIVFVSHFLEQVYAISDRMTVLRDGRVQGEFLTSEIERAELISLMLGGNIGALKRIGSERRAHRQEPDGPPVLEAEGLTQHGVVEPTDLRLYRGEVVGFAGLRGSGRTELAALLSGVARADGGELRVDGVRVRLDSPRQALARRVVASTEDRAELGIVGDLSVADNIVLSLQALRGWRHPVSRREREELVRWSVENFGLSAVPVNLPARYLSGGAQQKVLLARLFATRPLVMVLDEPTRGVDIAAKVEVQAKIAGLVEQGMAVVFISSEFSEVVRMSDRIVVLKDRGKIGELGNGPGVTVDTIVELIAADDDMAG